MQTKLTLRIESSLISVAKKYSKTRGKSLSQLFSDYILLITSQQAEKTQEMPPLTQALNGILRGKKINEKAYKKYLKDKYQ
jgi:hypothetical protein